jgi:HlyD family secretion protein
MRKHLALTCLSIVTLLGCQEASPPFAVGTLERHRIELRAERQEPILELAVREGDQVEAGDPIVVLDPRRVAAQLDQARATGDLSAAKLAEVVRGARAEEIERARADLAEAEAALIELQPEVVRIEKLVKEGIEAQTALESVEAAITAARARRSALQATLERLLNGATVEELDQARADVARSAAEIERLEIDVERMTVSAPRAGIIDALPFKVGDEPRVGATVAVLLADAAPFARVYVPAELRPGLEAGQTVSVRVDGFPEPFAGAIRLLASEAAFTPYYSLTERDRKHLAYLAEIDLLGDEARDLPTGLPVEVTF